MTEQEVDNLQAGTEVCLHDLLTIPLYGMTGEVSAHHISINWTGTYGLDVLRKTSPVWHAIKVRK